MSKKSKSGRLAYMGCRIRHFTISALGRLIDHAKHYQAKLEVIQLIKSKYKLPNPHKQFAHHLSSEISILKEQTAMYIQYHHLQDLHPVVSEILPALEDCNFKIQYI